MVLSIDICLKVELYKDFVKIDGIYEPNRTDEQ